MTQTKVEMDIPGLEMIESMVDHLPLAEVIRENKGPYGMKGRGWDSNHPHDEH